MTENELRLAVASARDDDNGVRSVTYRAALYLPRDELVLCLFDASSHEAVKRASERAGMPCERVIETVWIGGPRARDLGDPRKGDLLD